MSTGRGKASTYAGLADKTAFITGGGSGIGAAFTRAFAGQGARVGFVDVAEEAGRTLAAQIQKETGRTPLFIGCDLRDIAALQEAIEIIRLQLGDIGVLINNAGNDDRHAMEQVTPAYWDERIAVNLRHMFFAAQAVAPQMKRLGGGAILNLGSIIWRLKLTGAPVYNVTKASITGLTRVLAREFGPFGIRVNTIPPGAVWTDRQMKLWYTPQVEKEIMAGQCLKSIAAWAAKLGYKGVQIPSWDARLFDLRRAAESKSYCDEIRGTVAEHGLEITELSTHLQGQLVAVHPAYDVAFGGFAPEKVRGNSKARQAWAVEQLLLAAKASANLGLTAHVTFSGALAWPYIYPWPQRPAGLIETAFQELGSRWLPILNAFEEVGVDLCFEIHPGEDLHDGATFEMFLDRVKNHPRCQILFDPSHFVLQQLDYLEFIDLYHERIKMFHVKDAEFRPTGRQGVYGGYQPWINRAGRFRSPGDGQVDFTAIFSKLTQYGFPGWAVLEWECCLKHPEDGAREGAKLIADHIIRVTEKAFDDFAGAGADVAANRRMLGVV